MAKRRKHHYRPGGHGRKRIEHPAYASHTFRPNDDWHVLSFDGSCTANGSPEASGGWGWRLTDSLGSVEAEGSGRATVRPVTCNTAEFEGLIGGLEAVARMRSLVDRGLLIRGDSDFVIRLVNGDWTARDQRFVKFLAEALDWIDAIGVGWSAKWVRRDDNAECDDLSLAYMEA